MYKIGQPISKTDFYKLALLGLEAKHKNANGIKIYSTRTEGLTLQLYSSIHSFENSRQTIETDLNCGNFLISRLPNIPLLKRKSNV